MKFLLNIILIFFFFNAAIAENHLQFFIDSALKDEPITIHGDGSQSRSFTWVGDVVEYEFSSCSILLLL